MNFKNGGSKYFRTNFSYISAKFGVSITKSQETIDFSDFLEIALKIENLDIQTFLIQIFFNSVKIVLFFLRTFWALNQKMALKSWDPSPFNHFRKISRNVTTFSIAVFKLKSWISFVVHALCGPLEDIVEYFNYF